MIAIVRRRKLKVLRIEPLFRVKPRMTSTSSS